MKTLFRRFITLQTRATLRARVMFGVILVSLPLIYGLFDAAEQIKNFVYFSQKAVENYKEMTLLMASIHVETIELNRKAQQYIAIREKEYLEMYQQKSNIIKNDVEKLSIKVKQYEKFQAFLLQYLKIEQDVYETLLNHLPNPDSKERKVVLDKITLLEKITKEMLYSDYIMQQTSNEMKHHGSSITNSLFIKGGLLLIITILVSIWLFYMITQPLKKIEQAINRLGIGQLDLPIEIKGSSDVAKLGRHLEWLRQRLNDLETSKTRFIQHVSHDLKTPLTAIKESISLMHTSNSTLLSEEQQELLQIAQRNSLQLQKLIEDLLNFQNAYSQTIRLELTMQRIDFLIERVCEQHCLTLRARQLDLKLDLIEITLLIDKDKFYTIIDNLLSNALKYAPNNSIIGVRSWQDNKQFFITIHDDGVGIPKEHWTRVFNPFYQVNSPAKGAIKGSGLGLAIVQYYVQAHQGQIDILECERGTTFQISLPLV